MSGESTLAKLYVNNPNAYIVDDVNKAQRSYFLSKHPTVIPVRLGGADDPTQVIWELPGRNRFMLQVAVESDPPNAGAVKLQGSLTGTSSTQSNKWADIPSGSISCTQDAISAALSDERPFRFFRLLVTTPVTSGRATVFVSFMNR